MASNPQSPNTDELSRRLDQLEAEAAELRSSLRDSRDRLIASAVLSETLLKRVAGEAGDKISELSERVDRAESELARIKESFGWRILSHYGRFKHSVLLPILNGIGFKRSKRPQSPADGRKNGQMYPEESSQEGIGANRAEAEHGFPKRLPLRAVGFATSTLTIDPVIDREPLKAHKKSVDVVVCVHNALNEVRECLDSIVRYTRMPYRLVIVDDGSSDETRDYLRGFAESQGVTLIRNEEARGYTRAANLALKQSTADYIILLNSDTDVTPAWLDRLVACGESDPRIGIAGPLSNAASWQSVPETFVDGTTEWAVNPLVAGESAAEAALSIAQYSPRLYPELPFLNGFCFAIKRELINAIGIFDEDVFGDGYGEENDYCLRAEKAGWKRALADDAYVYHHETRSYTPERKKELSKRADDLLIHKHTSKLIDPGVAVCYRGRVIEGIRARVRVMGEREKARLEGRRLWEGKRVLFILPIAECNGGGNVVLAEAGTMREMGVDAQIVNLASHREGFEAGYPGLDLPVFFVDRSEDMAGLASDYDAVIATFHDSVFWLDYSRSERPRVRRAYYIQDFEPYFTPFRSPAFHHALASYTAYDDLVRIVKSEWNRRVIEEHSGADCYVNGPTVDIDLFRPRPRKDPEWPNRPLRILAMIRPMTPRRSPLFTLQVLADIERDRGAEVEIILFGCRLDDPEFIAILNCLPRQFPFKHAGMLTRRQTAALLNEVDIFCDLSCYQALGLTALEAMACGAAVVAPREGGASSFIKDGESGLLADTGSRDSPAAALSRLVADANFRSTIQQAALRDACAYYPERSAFKMLEALFRCEEAPD